MNYGKHKFEVGMTLYFIGDAWWEPQTEPTAIKITSCELDHVGEMSYFYGEKSKIYPFEINKTIFYDEARAKKHIALNLARKANNDSKKKAMDAVFATNQAEAEKIKPNYVGKEVRVRDWQEHGDKALWRKATVKDVRPGYTWRNQKGRIWLQLNETYNGYNLSNEGKTWRFPTDAEKEVEQKAKEEAEAKAKADEEKQKAFAAEAEKKAKIEVAEKKLAQAKDDYKEALARVRGFRAELKEAEKEPENAKK
jgi:hypothetical protein